MTETSRRGILVWYWSCNSERINILSNSIECNHPSRDTSSLLYSKSFRLKTGEVLYEKAYMSPRPPPKISLRHDWTKELGSDVARQPREEIAQQPRGEVSQQAKFFQPTQPTPNPIRERSGRLDSTRDGRKTSRSGEIDGNSFCQEPSSSERTERLVETNVNPTRSSQDKRTQCWTDTWAKYMLSNCSEMLILGKNWTTWYFLWSVNKLARSITKWTKDCDKRLNRLISYIHHTSEYKQYCHVGNTPKQCRLGLFQDSDFAGDLEDSKSTSGGTLCIFGSQTCSNRLDVPETNCCFAQLNRIWNYLFGHWTEIRWFACSGIMGFTCFCSWKCFSCFR